jgi:glycolate oxidase iron-sulfur subunit
VAHTVQMLDASIRGVPVEQVLESALNGPGTVAASVRPGRDRAAAPSS